MTTFILVLLLQTVDEESVIFIFNVSNEYTILFLSRVSL